MVSTSFQIIISISSDIGTDRAGILERYQENISLKCKEVAAHICMKLKERFYKFRLRAISRNTDVSKCYVSVRTSLLTEIMKKKLNILDLSL